MIKVKKNKLSKAVSEEIRKLSGVQTELEVRQNFAILVREMEGRFESSLQYDREEKINSRATGLDYFIWAHEEVCENTEQEEGPKDDEK